MRTSIPRYTRLLLAGLCASACATTTAPASPTGDVTVLTFASGDVVEHYGDRELALEPGSPELVDAAGQRYRVREEEDPRQGCALLDDGEPPQVLGHFGVPDDGEGFDSCSYLGAPPARSRDRAWLLGGTMGQHCAYRVDELRAALHQGQAPRCRVELQAAANPPGGAPAVVGWLGPHHVVVKTAFCCGSSKYHVINLDSGRAIGLGMSFESQQHRQFPALRPLSAQRGDYWLVQRSDDPQAEFPTAIAVVHCARVLDYLDSGQGAHAELRVQGRRVPDASSLSIPATAQPCAPGQGVLTP